MTHKYRKKNYCWIFSLLGAYGSFCSLCILYGGLRISKL
jgi:hypothetical protein